MVSYGSNLEIVKHSISLESLSAIASCHSHALLVLSNLPTLTMSKLLYKLCYAQYTHTFHHCFIVFATDRRVTPSHRLTYGNPVRAVDAKQPKCETHRHEGRLRSLSFRLGKSAGKIRARATLGAHAIRGERARACI